MRDEPVRTVIRVVSAEERPDAEVGREGLQRDVRR